MVNLVNTRGLARSNGGLLLMALCNRFLICKVYGVLYARFSGFQYPILARMCSSVLRRKHQSVSYKFGPKWKFPPCSYSKCETKQKLCCV